MTTSELERRLSEATGPDRELDEAIAEALFGVTVWKSKHGYWNVSFPQDWAFGGKDHNVSMPGRGPGYDFDPETGKRLPPETRPSGWADDTFVDLPEWTASIDAALALVERKIPGTMVSMTQLQTCWQVSLLVGARDPEAIAEDWTEDGSTAPLAICLCLIRALATQEPTNGK